VREIDVNHVAPILSDLVNEVVETGERIVFTRDGHPVVVLLSVDEFESLEETVFWMTKLRKDQENPEHDRVGRVVTEAQIRAEFGVAPRSQPEH